MASTVPPSEAGDGPPPPNNNNKHTWRKLINFLKSKLEKKPKRNRGARNFFGFFSPNKPPKVPEGTTVINDYQALSENGANSDNVSGGTTTRTNSQASSQKTGLSTDGETSADSDKGQSSNRNDTETMPLLRRSNRTIHSGWPAYISLSDDQLWRPDPDPPANKELGQLRSQNQDRSQEHGANSQVPPLIRQTFPQTPSTYTDITDMPSTSKKPPFGRQESSSDYGKLKGG